MPSLSWLRICVYECGNCSCPESGSYCLSCQCYPGQADCILTRVWEWCLCILSSLTHGARAELMEQFRYYKGNRLPFSTGANLDYPLRSCPLVPFKPVPQTCRVVARAITLCREAHFPFWWYFNIGRNPCNGLFLSVWLISPAEPRQILPAKSFSCCIYSRNTCQYSHIYIQH